MSMSNSHKSLRYRTRFKWRLVEYKGGKCEKCGYCKKIPAAYDFHHVGKKDFGIGSRKWDFERAKIEVDKCMLLCRNCHAEVHYGELDESVLVLLRDRVSEKNCLFCNEKFRPHQNKQKYCCHRCSQLGRRKVERPCKKQLTKELSQSNFSALGRKYDVSDKSVRKWAKQYGII